MDEIHEKRRKQLQDKLICAALDIFDHMGPSAFRLTIPLTNPQMYIYVGTKEDIKKLLEE
jgi:hypothetical protein